MKKPNRICQTPACNGKGPGRYCRQCTEQREKDRKPYREKPRPTAASKGYGARWQKYRRLFLFDHPWCAECEKLGRQVPATLIHHIRKPDGNYELFWDESNHCPVCRRHHAVVTARGE